MTPHVLAKWLEQYAAEMVAAGEPMAGIRDIRQAVNVIERREEKKGKA